MATHGVRPHSKDKSFSASGCWSSMVSRVAYDTGCETYFALPMASRSSCTAVSSSSSTNKSRDVREGSWPGWVLRYSFCAVLKSSSAFGLLVAGTAVRVAVSSSTRTCYCRIQHVVGGFQNSDSILLYRRGMLIFCDGLDD